MKRYIPLVIALGSLLSVAALAQTPPPPRGATSSPPATATSSGGTGAEGKIAVVVTDAFTDQILELKIKMDALKAELDPMNKEIQSLTEQIGALKTQVEKQGSTVSVATRNQWMEKGADMEKQLKRKQEDYESLGQKRFVELVGPIQDKIGKFLEDYATKRGITLVIEGAAAQKAGLLLWAADATNITDDFIKEYNKANPVLTPTSSTPPKRDKD